ncbi:MAG: hypothetical protein V4615_05120 [Bacteroidota bacterium]
MIKQNKAGNGRVTDYRAERKEHIAPKVRVRYEEDGVLMLKTECGKTFVAEKFDAMFTPVKTKVKSRRQAQRDANPDKTRIV